MGIESSDTYRYREDLPHDDIYVCRYNESNSIGKING